MPGIFRLRGVGTVRRQGGLEMLKSLVRFMRDEEAPTAVEYGIMVAGIAVVIIAVVFLLGANIKNVLNATAVHIAVPPP
jgi:pilus assembly protein Flp/PilA